MVPTVDTESGEKDADGRKNRKCGYQEARLTLSHPKGAVTSVFGCTLGNPSEAGDQMSGSAILSGMGQKTEVRRIGDGAPRIAGQVGRVFGGQGGFLIDFYHLRGYLSDAACICSPHNSPAFFIRQKQLAEEGQIAEALGQMIPYAEPDGVPDDKAPVRRCARYITNRPGQSDYKEAEEKGLPIGSGEIGSAHRYIIRKRLKIPGAWRKENNAQNMLSLRVLRANGEWETYWGNIRKAV